MKPDQNKEVTTTKKKGNVIINPKKEDLMSESLRKKIQSEVEALRESAKKKAKHIKAAKAGKRWQDSDGDGKWYEPGEDVRKEETEIAEGSCGATVDDTAAKEKAKERMKQKMMQMTKDFDAKRQGRQAK
tara:strand:+ start:1947 stop:2336 length:390 start_codon:yes stop_codon:yes gene_type:complete